MSEAAPDPYAVLGVGLDVSDIELRRVYRGLVKRYHPDHNGGSPESAARFAQIQNAYDQIAHSRLPPGSGPPEYTAAQASGGGGTAAADEVRYGAGDAGVEERIASLEREMAAIREAERRRAEEQARRASEQTRRAAASSAAGGANGAPRRPTPEELGYYNTDDSFTKIIDDAADELGERLRKSDAKRQFTRRLSELFGRDD